MEKIDAIQDLIRALRRVVGDPSTDEIGSGTAQSNGLDLMKPEGGTVTIVSMGKIGKIPKAKKLKAMEADSTNEQ